MFEQDLSRILKGSLVYVFKDGAKRFLGANDWTANIIGPAEFSRQMNALANKYGAEKAAFALERFAEKPMLFGINFGTDYESWKKFLEFICNGILFTRNDLLKEKSLGVFRILLEEGTDNDALTKNLVEALVENGSLNDKALLFELVEYWQAKKPEVSRFMNEAIDRLDAKAKTKKGWF
jgi:hypothetical protein